MRVHAIQTGTVSVTERQREGRGPGPLRPLATMLDRDWTGQLPIYAWAIEHPEGVIVVDTGETARLAESHPGRLITEAGRSSRSALSLVSGRDQPPVRCSRTRPARVAVMTIGTIAIP